MSCIRNPATLQLAADLSQVTAFSIAPQSFVELGASPLDVYGNDISLGPIIPAAPIFIEVTVPPRLSATVAVEYNLRYQTVDFVRDGVDIKTLPTPYEAAPFLLEVQQMMVDTAVVPQTVPPTLVPDPSSDPTYHLLAFTGWTNVPDLEEGIGAFVADGRLLLGPFLPAAADVPGYQRLALVAYHESGDWNESGMNAGGWSVLPFTNPFPGMALNLLQQGIAFDLRYGSS